MQRKGLLGPRAFLRTHGRQRAAAGNRIDAGPGRQDAGGADECGRGSAPRIVLGAARRQEGRRQTRRSGERRWGLEVILQGRDPRDAWAFCERICGVCTTVHALASVRAVENSLGIQVPRNADIIRNIMFLTQMVQDHVIHFYHLHALDWVDVVSALKANPAATAALAQKVSPNWPTATEGYFRDVAATLSKFVASGQLGIF